MIPRIVAVFQTHPIAVRHRGVEFCRRAALMDELHVWRVTDGNDGGAPIPSEGIVSKAGVVAGRNISGGRGGLTVKGE